MEHDSRRMCSIACKCKGGENMEKNRSSKFSLSVGFAAFSNSLVIKSSAKVTPNSSTFNVDFSSSGTSLATTAVAPTKTPTTLTATSAAIDNTSDPTISNLSVTFTEPGQKVVYTFYAYNAGQYDAYLKSITYANVTGKTAAKVCTAASGTTDTLVQAACDDITVSVKVGDLSEVSGSKASITGHTLAKGAFEQVTVTIEYASNGDRADGDFTVAFGDITLLYSSAN
jgi:hypothetical protein